MLAILGSAPLRRPVSSSPNQQHTVLLSTSQHVRSLEYCLPIVTCTGVPADSRAIRRGIAAVGAGRLPGTRNASPGRCWTGSTSTWRCRGWSTRNWSTGGAGEPSLTVRGRVEAARRSQAARFAGTALLTNADMGPRDLTAHAALDPAGENLMKAAVAQLALSARGYHRVLKLARTIADLAGEASVTTALVAEALQYRPRQLVG